MIVAVGAASFAVAWVVARLLVSRWGALVLDQPNERSLHARPVPRTGGIAVLLGAAVSLVFGGASLALPLAVTLVLAVISFTDDVRGVPTAVRLAAHLAGAAVVCWYYLSPMHPLQLALLMVAMAWLTNVYNFMDGSDGLAAGMSVIGFGAYAAAAHLGGHAALAAVCTALAAAALAFLLHNFSPARIFLGDVGSIPLGFLAGALGIVGWRDDLWPLWFPVLVFGPFLGDATVTLVKRLVRGERVWRAHREHYYQRMVRMGLGHRRTALIAYAVMALCAVAALVGRRAPPEVQTAAFGAAALVLAALAIWVDVRWARFLRQPPQPA